MEEKEYKYGEDYYKMLNDENYSALLDREVQIENARERALRQTNVGLASLGMQSSGYGQTAKSGIESQYLSALMDNEQQRIQYLNQKETEAENSKYQDYLSFSNLLTQTNNLEDLDFLLGQYGLGTSNTFDLNKASELFGEKYGKELQYLNRLQVNGLSSGNKEYSYTGKGDYTYYDKDGNIKTIKLEDGTINGWNAENRTLQGAINTGELPNNSFVKLINSKGNTIYVRYSGGRLYYTNKAEYDNSTSKYYIKEYNAMQKDAGE